MFASLANFVSRHWLLVISFWLTLAIALYAIAPRWDDVTHDGDLAYLPAEMPTAVAEELLTRAFPNERAKSQIVIVAAREGEELLTRDLAVATDLARRFHALEGAARFEDAKRLARQADEQTDAADTERLRKLSEAALEDAQAALDEAALLDDELYQYWEGESETLPATGPLPQPRLAAIYFNRALVAEYQDKKAQAEEDRQRAIYLRPELAVRGPTPIPDEAANLPLLDVWTWYDDVFGKKLASEDNQARLVVLQLSNEFMATDNVRVLELVEAEIAPVLRYLPQVTTPGLQIGLSGSAAVGGDMLRAAANSIRHTELVTVLLVVLILILVYRSPLLVLVPLITILVSLYSATSVVALLTQLGKVPGFEWWEMKVFTTTKIFIVVILFGAGTDYCLFLIARYREEIGTGQDYAGATVGALSGVGDALAASALTTILGLATMYFADFGKFRYSGPVIGLCLAITLMACMTLTPALLRAFGRTLFWPGRAVAAPDPNSTRLSRRLWERLARWIVTYPATILAVSFLLLVPWAVYGWQQVDNVTYDFLRALPTTSPSRRGAELLRTHFPIGESGPLTVVVWKEEGDFASRDARREIAALSDALHIDGVRTVRSIADPLGDHQPGEYVGFAVGLRAMRAHPRTEQIFLAQTPELAGQVMRVDVVLEDDPFSSAARDTLRQVDTVLKTLSEDPESFWHQATFAYSGTTAGVRDLRAVTQSDNRRIQILVVLAVLAVLLIILRRPFVSLYMIVSVLFSYYVTIGMVVFILSWGLGSDFQGLDWKLPLFLFVILVAVGEDYNVYLATRVFEEQQRLGPFAGLRRAIVCTGGIITSCGVIMAGTFASMTSGTWGYVMPDFIPLSQTLFANAGVLRGIVEMGFALSLGVMLDTFVVRPILVPAFLALLCRWQTAR